MHGKQRHDCGTLSRPAAARRSPVERQTTVAALMVGEPAEHSGLDRTAPTTVRHRGGVAGAEVRTDHRVVRIWFWGCWLFG